MSWRAALRPFALFFGVHVLVRAAVCVAQADSLGFQRPVQVAVGLANDLFVSLAFILALILASRLPRLRAPALAAVRGVAALTLILVGANLVNVLLTGNNLTVEEFAYLNPRDFPDLLGSAVGFALAWTGIPLALGVLLLALVVWLIARSVGQAGAVLGAAPGKRVAVLCVGVLAVAMGSRSFALSWREILYEPVETHVLPHLLGNAQAQSEFDLEMPTRGIELYRQRLVAMGAKPLGDAAHPLLAERDFRTHAPTTALGLPPALPPKTNVVVILLESFGRGTFLHSPQAVPYVGDLLKGGLELRSHYTTAFRTVGAQFSALCSQHNPVRFYVSRQFPKTEMRCLPSVLKDLGYRTMWVTGTTKMGDYNEEWLKGNGVDVRVGSEDFPDGTPRFSYGIHDGPVYDRLLRELDQAPKPSFTFVATISTHHPFVIPGDFLAKHPEIQSFTNVEQSFYYASTELKRFFDEAKTRPWYKDTLFVLFGDHAAWGTEGGSPTDPDFEKTRQRYHVSASFLHPQIAPAAFDGDTGHTDLAPTILDLLGVKAASDLGGQSVYAWKAPVALGSQENARDTYYTIHTPARVIYRSSVGRLCQMAEKGIPARAVACDAAAWQVSEDYKATYFDTVQWEVLKLQGLTHGLKQVSGR